MTWIRLDTTQALLKRLVEQRGAVPVWSERKKKGHPNQEIITEIPRILETTREDGVLLTYSTTELAVVYARFLSVECYEWALTALVEGNEGQANLVEQIEKETSLGRERMLSRRRALIAAGWAVPVIATIGLHNKAVAAGSSPPEGAPDIVSDPAPPRGGEVSDPDRIPPESRPPLPGTPGGPRMPAPPPSTLPPGLQ
jgi:hypothetical protein